jgi:hypothetical protein
MVTNMMTNANESSKAQIGNDEIVYSYSGGRMQIFILLVLLPGCVIMLMAAFLVFNEMKQPPGSWDWVKAIALSAFSLGCVAVLFPPVFMNPLLRSIRVTADRRVRVSYTYLWKRLHWEGSAQQVKRVMVKPFDSGEGDMHYMEIELLDGQWLSLGACKDDLDEATLLHAAMGLECQPTMERLPQNEGNVSYMKARKNMRSV